MGKTHEEQLQLKSKLQLAQEQVEVGALYRHYKSSHKIYKVLNLAFQEENNELCVIYRAEYEERLIFIRPLKSWLETIELKNEKVLRFTKI